MHFKNVVIDSMACALPSEVWTSERIEESLLPLYNRLQLPKGRLEMMTGIHERRHWDVNCLPSDVSIKAGEKLLQKSSANPEEIDVLIHASVCRNRLEPATAAYVHKGLRLSGKTQIFDVSNACLGVLNAMVVGASMIEAGTARSVLIVSGENGRSLLDNTVSILNNDTSLTRQTIKPYFANLTIGSGGVAVLLKHTRDVCEPKPLLLGGVTCTDSEASSLCEGQGTSNGLAMQTDAPTLLNAGIDLANKAWEQFKDNMFWDEATPDCIVTHQVGRQHQRKLYDALGLDIGKDFSTYSELGNTGSVALPLSLCKADEQQRLNPGDKVLLLGIGSGLSTLMLGLIWQK